LTCLQTIKILLGLIKGGDKDVSQKGIWTEENYSKVDRLMIGKTNCI